MLAWLAVAAMAGPLWSFPDAGLPPQSDTHRDTLYHGDAPPPPSQAELQARLQLLDSDRQFELWCGGLGLAVGLAGAGGLSLSQNGQDRGDVVLQAGEGILCLAGGAALFSGLIGLLVTSANIHALKAQLLPNAGAGLRLSPLLLAQGRAPGLGLTVRF
jgi:hypothetical protein